MKKAIVFLFLLGVVIVSRAGEKNMSTKVESVTIYHSGALVSRVGLTGIQPGLHELVFKDVSSKILLNSLKVGNKEITILNKSIIKKLSEEEMNQLLDQKEALTKQMALIEMKYAEPGFVSEVEQLETMTEFYAKKTVQIKRDLRRIEKMIEEAKKLEGIQLKNENAAILKLTVSIDGSLTKAFEMQYVCGGIGWTPAYEISVESSAEKTVEVKYLAKAMSQTGEDWENVQVNLSSAFPLDSPTDLPRPKEPWALKGGRYSYNTNSPNQANARANEIDRLEGVEYDEISVPSFLKLRTLKEKYSLKSNSTVFTFPIQTVNLPANFYYYGFPSIDPEVYLVAELTGWDTLGFVDGIASISFKGNNVGRSVIKFSEAKDTLLLPVGKDNSVFMKRNEIGDQKYFKITTIGKKRKTTLAYSFELKNNNSFPVNFELVDQVPISQTKSAEVEIEKTSGGDLNNEIGEVTWNMDLQPGKSVSKELIFTIEMDANYNYYRVSNKSKYKKIATPRF